MIFRAKDMEEYRKVGYCHFDYHEKHVENKNVAKFPNLRTSEAEKIQSANW